MMLEEQHSLSVKPLLLYFYKHNPTVVSAGQLVRL